MSSTVLIGVNEDIERFLYKFANKKSFKFESFCEVWKEMQFSYIYSGRPTVTEMKIFTREILILIKSHAIGTYTMWEKSGAIFLLYALYHLQPLSNKVPIRIEQKELFQLIDFANEMKSSNMEVSFCIYKLLIYNAFDLVFREKLFSMESAKDGETPKKDNQNKTQKKYKYDKFAMGSLLTSIGFDPDSSAHREAQYNDIKQALNEKFPHLCNFELRRFAVNLLVPSVQSEDSPTAEQPDVAKTSKKKKREIKRKTKELDPALFSLEDEIIESTLSMPLIPNIGSDIEDPLEEGGAECEEDIGECSTSQN